MSHICAHVIMLSVRLSSAWFATPHHIQSVIRSLISQWALSAHSTRQQPYSVDSPMKVIKNEHEQHLLAFTCTNWNDKMCGSNRDNGWDKDSLPSLHLAVAFFWVFICVVYYTNVYILSLAATERLLDLSSIFQYLLPNASGSFICVIHAYSLWLYPFARNNIDCVELCGSAYSAHCCPPTAVNAGRE